MGSLLPTYTPTQTGNLYVSFAPDRHASIKCPVSPCIATIKGWTGLQRHFQHRHYDDTIIIYHYPSQRLFTQVQTLWLTM